jgi:hypothetical protein
MASNFLKGFGDHVADFVKFVKQSLEDEAIRKSIAEDLGLEPGQSIEKPKDQKLDSVDSYRSKADPDKEAFINLLNDARSLYENVRTCISGFGPTEVTRLNAVLYFIFDTMAENYVRLYIPRAYYAIQALSAIVEDTSALDDDPFAVKRFAVAIERAGIFALSPLGYTYKALKSGIADEESARKISDRIFPPLAAVVASSLIEQVSTKQIIYGWDSFEKAKKESCFDEESASSTPTADAISERTLSFAFPLSQDPTPTSEVGEQIGATLALVPKTHTPKPGLFIGLTGEGTVEIPLTDKWKFVLEASAKPAFSLLLQCEDWNMDAGAGGPTDLPLNVALVSIPDSQDITYAIPHPNESGVQIGQLNLSFRFDGKTGGIRAQALRCALVLASKDHDGLLAKFLPSDGLRIPFNFGLGFSTDQGFFTEGNVPLLSGHSTGPLSLRRPIPLSHGSATEMHRLPGAPLTAPLRAGESSGSPDIPKLSGTSQPELGIQGIISVGKTLLNLTIDHIVIGLVPSQGSTSPKPAVELSVSLILNIGPVQAVIDRIGVELGFSFPESGGNAGFADFSLAFKPPSGVGIKVDSPVVSGGGFLFLDPQNGQYAGFVQLSVYETITVTAIGLISTRLPSGAKGFSFLILITAEGFRPIPLGLGFTLTGIGGLLALNRTCNEDFLREGIKNKTLNDVLFPKNPVVNAVQIFGTLNNAFPASEGSYLFGPVLQICWGTPPLITMDLGVIAEVGSRNRVVILGRVSAILPSEKQALIRLNMNALGVIDFDRNSISLDAVLYDSRFVNKFPVTGSMLMRLNWGASRMFALSIGGFHPAFKPPSDFPTQQRLAISFSDSEDFRLRVEGYFAITSNTLQFGARAELFANADGFTIVGQIGYDVLIQFDPFAFLAGFYASMQIKRGSHNLLKVEVRGELAGPRPLHIKGKVKFEIFWFDITISIDRTLISGDPPPALEPVRVMEKLKAALQESRNWTGQLAEGDRRAVTLRENPNPDQVALHPLGRISVKQTIVPLGLDIAKFGSARPADARLFRITQLTIGGHAAGISSENDFFAPAQFLELTDDEKLAAPSFEAMAAGVTTVVQTFIFTTSADDITEDEAIQFETIILDKQNNDSRQSQPFPISAQTLDRQIVLGAAARSDLRRSGAAKYRGVEGKNATTKKGWTIVSAIDGSSQPAPGLDAGKVVTYSESFQALNTLKHNDPQKAKNLMLVRVSKQ